MSHREEVWSWESQGSWGYCQEEEVDEDWKSYESEKPRPGRYSCHFSVLVLFLSSGFYLLLYCLSYSFLIKWFLLVACVIVADGSKKEVDGDSFTEKLLAQVVKNLQAG